MKLNRRQFLHLAGCGGLIGLAGCELLPRPGWIKPAERSMATGWQAPAGAEVDATSHLLSRMTYGARPGDYARVSAMGAEAFLEEQLHPADLADEVCDYALRRLETLRCPERELFEYKDEFLLRELSRATLLRAVYSERQLYEMMVDFWTDHLNIAWFKGDCRWLKAADDREVIRKHALGKFPELLRASALSPAMLWYLDGRVNRRRNEEEKPNENYARELLELHTLGVDGGYTQHDVMEAARCLTGWTVTSDKLFGRGKVAFERQWHDDGPKEVLGQSIPAGLGEGDLDRVLEIVTRHPSTARHLARRLCQKFVDDAPPQACVDVVAAAYTRTEGDISAMLRTLFQHEDFRTSRGTKLKRPLHFMAAALRATGAETDAGEPLLDYLLRMGHASFQYPTPDGYPQEAAPWLGTLLWRWHFAFALRDNRLPGVRVDWDRLAQGFGKADELMAHVLGRRATGAECAACGADTAGIALLLASPAFQRC